MDFAFTPEQQALRDLAGKIMETPAARLTELEASGRRHDDVMWSDLAQAGLTDLGADDFLELCVVLEQAGRTVAPVPMLGHALGVLAVGPRPGEILCAVPGHVSSGYASAEAPVVPGAAVATSVVVVDEDRAAIVRGG